MSEQIDGAKDILGGSITRYTLNTSTPNQAVIRKIIAGAGISIESSGVDAGTGDVIISVNLSGTGSGGSNTGGGGSGSGGSGSSNVGTVTSVNMTTPVGLTVVGNPITTAGTLMLSLSDGYTIPLISDVNKGIDAFNKKIVSVSYNTTTGQLTLNQNDTGTLTTNITLNPFTTSNLTEGSNLYYTDTRARAAISLTVTGNSGAATYSNTTGVLNIPTYTLSGLGGQPLSANLTSLSGLTYTAVSFVKMTAAGTFALDTNVYITGNQTITLSGDISGSGSTSITTTIGANKVTLSMLAQIATARFLGRTTAGTGNVESLTATQATALLDLFSTTAKGLVPVSTGGTTNFLRADGTWAAPSGGGGGSSGTTTNPVTFNNSGSGNSSGITFDGSAAVTVSYNTIGAQQASSVLSGLAALSYVSGSPFVKMTGAGTFSLDTTTYLTGNQTITLTGNVTGSGTTSIATTIANGVVTNAMLVNSSFNIGTTSISLGRASAAQTLTGVSIDGNSGTVTDGVYITGSYANPAWITSLAWSKITGAPAFLTAESDTLATVTGRGATTSTPIVLQGSLAAWNATTPGTANGGLHLGAASATTDFGPAITFGARDSASGTTAQAGIYVISGGNFGTIMYIATTDAYATGSKTAISISNGGVVNFVRSRPTALGNTIWDSGNLTNLNQLTNGPGYITSSASITGAAARLTSRDIRTIAPNSESASELRFGFTSWANNNTAPYADFLHLRSYLDGSGGNDNLVLFRKDAIGMRIYQQSFGSTTAYSNFVDVLHSANYTSYSPTLTGTGASGTWSINVTGTAGSETLATVTGRGASTSTAVVFNGNVSIGTTATLSFGSSTRQMLNLWSTEYGLGVQSGTLYYRSNSRFSWHRGGTHNDSENNPGGGTVAMTLDGSSNLAVTGSITSGGTAVVLNNGGTWSISITGSAATATSADNIDGWSFVNTGSNSATAADSINSNGISYVGTNISLFGQSDGALFSQAYSSVWQHQIYGDYRTGQIAIRGKNNGTWQSWRTVLDSSNYNSYAPTLTGAGASGTWGINVTGSSSTAALLTTSGSLTTQYGDGTVGYVYALNTSTSGIFPAVDNSNAILTISRHPGNYYSQLGFSSNANIYYRRFSAAAINTTQSWDVLLTSANYNSYAIARGGDTVSGVIYFQSNLGSTSGSLNNPPLQVYATGSNAAFMSFHRASIYAVNFGLDSDNVLRIGGWSASANRWELDMSGNCWVAGSMRAPIFYDSANTAYFLDANSYSRLNRLVLDQTRVNSSTYPIGHYTSGETVFEIDPTWSNDQLQAYFNSSNISWTNDSTAPGGYAIQIDGGLNVGGAYGSGFPFIPVDDSDIFYMECWIRSVSGSIGHYMGSIDYNSSFGSLGGNPGSFGYWVMSNTTTTTTWQKVSGYITGFGSTTGQFVSGTKYWTPQALFNYSQYSGSSCVISGWKVIKVNHVGNRRFTGTLTVDNTVFLTRNSGITVGRFEYLSSPAGLTLRSEDGLSFSTGGNNVRVYITNSGNVGIGTTSPATKLDVNGFITSLGSLYKNAAGNNVLNVAADDQQYGGSSTDAGIFVYGNNKLFLSTNSSRQLTVDGSGNVGIGTTSPTQKLHVVGNGIISQYFDVGTASTNVNAYVRVLDGSVITKVQSIGSGNVGYLGTESNHNLQLLVNNDPKVTITSAGELWLGYTADQGAYLLQVNGAVYASAYYESSDIRLKTILDKYQINEFGVIVYKWKDNRDEKVHWGYSAQDVQKYLPDAVNVNNDGYLTLDYNQAHTYKIMKLEQEILDLKNKLNELRGVD